MSDRIPGPAARTWSAPGHGRSVDAVRRSTGLQMVLWSVVGGNLGFLLGWFLDVQDWGSPGLTALLTVAGFASLYAALSMITASAGRVAGAFLAPSGRSTPRAKEYSRAESFLARGNVDRSIEAFRAAIAEDASDPTPYLRIARLSRDRLRDPEAAEYWFRLALAEAQLPPRMLLLVLRELIELYEGPLDAPRRVGPLLARIADEWEGRPEGEWARRELDLIKSAVRLDPDPS